MEAGRILELSVEAMGRIQGLALNEKVLDCFAAPDEEASDGGLLSPSDRLIGELANESAALTPSGNGSYAFPPMPEGCFLLEYETKYRFNSSFREEFAANGQRHIAVFSQRGMARVAGDELVEEVEGVIDLYRYPLLYRDADMLLERLELAGVNTAVRSLGRFEGRIAFVIGAQYPDESRPQLWIDKDSFLPVRWIVTRQVPGQLQMSLEFRYHDWEASITRRGRESTGFFPQRIFFIYGGRIVRERIVQSMAPNPAFGRDDFDLEGIRAAKKPSQEILEQRALLFELEQKSQTGEDF
ncbi:MAG: hypothetical protein QMD09_10970 [Desulfatibacillaceae bacterium]|nr:hypothetical protein [Desulfatibacillaceae bacterium]